MSVTAADRDAAFVEDVRRVASEVAAAHAVDVDQQARFPAEAIDALREIGALSAFVPADLGGGEVSFAALAARAGIVDLAVSLTHEDGLASAVVVAELSGGASSTTREGR